MTEIHPDALLTRNRTAVVLTAAGYPIATATLRIMATRGGGPVYRKFGRVAVYRWGDALAWAEARLTAPRGNTSASDAHRAA